MVEADKTVSAGSTRPTFASDGGARDTQAERSTDEATLNFSDNNHHEAARDQHRHLLGAAAATGSHTCTANYGALNEARQSCGGHDHDSCHKSQLNETQSEVDSSILDTTSQMGESMRYREHVSQYTRERAGELLITIKDRVTFFGMSVLVLIPITLLANGVGYSSVTNQQGQSQVPMVAENGCSIGLNSWYIFLTALISVKLLIEIFRYICVKVNYQESIFVHMGGNFLLMPIAFAVFFVYTQTMWEHSNPDPDHVMSYHEA